MEKEQCPHCGANMKIWKHSLTNGLVQILKKFALAIEKKGFNNIHLQNEAVLTSNEYNNFQKLRYFGLVVKTEGESGKWKITRNGLAFLNGKKAIPNKVYTFRNRIVDRSEELVFIDSVDKDPFYEKRFYFQIFQGKLL